MAPVQQRERQTASRADTALHLSDLVSVSMIITDFDAETTASNAKRSDKQTSPRSASTGSTSSASASTTSLQIRATGFDDFADGLWKGMTEAMRAKLRDAAVEVLKRTDDTKSGAGEGQIWREWDEDARFLD